MASDEFDCDNVSTQSLTSGCAFDVTGFDTRGRRLCSTAARVAMARAIPGPSSKL